MSRRTVYSDTVFSSQFSHQTIDRTNYPILAGTRLASAMPKPVGEKHESPLAMGLGCHTHLVSFKQTTSIQLVEPDDTILFILFYNVYTGTLSSGNYAVTTNAPEPTGPNVNPLCIISAAPLTNSVVAPAPVRSNAFQLTV